LDVLEVLDLQLTHN